MPSSRAALSELRRALLEAPPDQIGRVIQLVDGMPDRVAADALIGPIRSRLARLGLRRQLSFTRLMFRPLDPVIVSANSWQPNSASIPRSVLPAMSELVASCIGADATALSKRLESFDTGHEQLIAAEGYVLWPRAAEILVGPETIADWREQTGLPAKLQLPLRRAVAVVLSRATALLMLERAASPPEDAKLLSVLQAGEGIEDGAELGIVLATFMANLPYCRKLLELTETLFPALGPASNIAARDAVCATFKRLQGHVAGEDSPYTLGLTARRATQLLNQLESWLAERPQMQTQAEEMRRALDQACRQCFETAMLAFEHAIRQPADHESKTLESAARELRELGTAGRQIGSREFYDQHLRRIGPAVFSSSALSRIKRSRLVEILSGPELAWELMEGERVAAAATAPGVHSHRGA